MYQTAHLYQELEFCQREITKACLVSYSSMTIKSYEGYKRFKKSTI